MSKKDLSATERRLRTPPPVQYRLDIGAEVQREVNGIEMGVLENGIPFLTQVGLAAMCGVSRTTIIRIIRECESTYSKPNTQKGRARFIWKYLEDNGYDQPRLYISFVHNKSLHHAYPDFVCMALLEAIAFESRKSNPTAIKHYRALAAGGFRQFVYRALSYEPEDKWKYFRDRQSLIRLKVPIGYFVIFQEISHMVVDLIGKGLTVNSHTLPDISVGLTWSNFWKANDLENQYSKRVPWEHSYPSYYEQSKSNPQVAWAYPEAALPEFRGWFRNTYLPTKFPAYILRKAGVLRGGKAEAQKLAAAFKKEALEEGMGKVTIKAMKEARKGNLPRFRTVKALLKDLHAGD